MISRPSECHGPKSVRRHAKKQAYSLLGIFDVHIPLILGEGREKAFKRLREEINKASKGKSLSLYH